MSCELDPSARILVTGGSGTMTRYEFAALLSATLQGTPVYANARDVNEVRQRVTVEQLTEIEIWNAKVDRRKAEKKASKA